MWKYSEEFLNTLMKLVSPNSCLFIKNYSLKVLFQAVRFFLSIRIIIIFHLFLFHKPYSSPWARGLTDSKFCGGGGWLEGRKERVSLSCEGSFAKAWTVLLGTWWALRMVGRCGQEKRWVMASGLSVLQYLQVRGKRWEIKCEWVRWLCPILRRVIGGSMRIRVRGSVRYSLVYCVQIFGLSKADAIF